MWAFKSSDPTFWPTLYNWLATDDRLNARRNISIVPVGCPVNFRQKHAVTQPCDLSDRSA